MKKVAVYFALLVSYYFSFFITAGLLWLIMTGLIHFGVPLPIEWSWVFCSIFWFTIHCIRILFKYKRS